MEYKLEEFNFNFDSLQGFLQSDALLCFVVLLLALKIITVSAPINFPQNIFFADITESTLENLVNQTRQADGIKPLTENQKLDSAAELKAENMVKDKYFNHTSPSGVSPWFWFLKAGYNYKYAGENLAVGFFDSEEVYNAWLNSPSHKANILNPNYTEIGTAVLRGFGQNNAVVVVQEFASPLPQANIAPVKNKVLSQTTVATGFVKSPSYNYAGLLQDIIYGISLMVIGALLTLIILSRKIIFKRELIFRAIFLALFLTAAALLNRGMIIPITPHQIII